LAKAWAPALGLGSGWASVLASEQSAAGSVMALARLVRVLAMVLGRWGLVSAMASG
jgi:hypothetical protein